MRWASTYREGSLARGTILTAPTLALGSGATIEDTVMEPVPLLEERVDIEMDVGLKLDNTLLRKEMGDHFVLHACSALLRVLKTLRCMEIKAS